MRFYLKIMLSPLTLPPLKLRPRQNVRPPSSKSISNRVLLMAALSNSPCHLHHLLRSEDTEAMLNALKILGIPCQQLGQEEFLIRGQGGIFPVKEAELFLHNAGTAYRSLCAILALQQGQYILKGSDRMHERPIAPLVLALQSLGANVDYLVKEGYPPLAIHPFHQKDIQEINITGSVSSQFISALLMALPLLNRPIQLTIEGELISEPYVHLTLSLLTAFGIQLEIKNNRQFFSYGGQYYQAPRSYQVESDASSASYFFAAAFLSNTSITVLGVDEKSEQGDWAFAHILSTLGGNLSKAPGAYTFSRHTPGKIEPFTLDATALPDAAMSLCIIALLGKGTSRIEGISSWRIKETDRIAAIAAELKKLGARVTAGDDFIEITPPKQLISGAHIATYEDHRMAMCFSLVALLGVSITIEDPSCVRKTFPNFFQVLAHLTEPQATTGAAPCYNKP